jgi:hypothetical protein
VSRGLTTDTQQDDAFGPQAKGPTADEGTNSENESEPDLAEATNIANWLAIGRALGLTIHTDNYRANVSGGNRWTLKAMESIDVEARNG